MFIKLETMVKKRNNFATNRTVLTPVGPAGGRRILRRRCADTDDSCSCQRCNVLCVSPIQRANNLTNALPNLSLFPRDIASKHSITVHCTALPATRCSRGSIKACREFRANKTLDCAQTEALIQTQRGKQSLRRKESN